MNASTSSQTPGRTVRQLNLLSTFLANPQLTTLTPPITIFNTSITSTPRNISPLHISPSTLILAPSAILHQAHVVFNHFQTCYSSPSSIKTLVLTGGIGHSTLHLYAAVLAHPVYRTLPSLLHRTDLTGLPEAQVYYLLFIHFHDGERVMKSWNQGQGLQVLVEDQSTNCGANARLSRNLLEERGVVLGADGDDVVIVQDPTMSLRTKASFEKVYEAEVGGGRVRFWTWPVFVPSVKVDEAEGGEEVVWNGARMEGVDVRGLWDLKRFYGLLLGEIPRLKDDVNGYGPKGKGFIAHVDVPEEVEAAWRELSVHLDFQR